MAFSVLTYAREGGEREGRPSSGWMKGPKVHANDGIRGGPAKVTNWTTFTRKRGIFGSPRETVAAGALRKLMEGGFIRRRLQISTV